MKLIIKFFAEVTIKSPQVRKRFVSQLRQDPEVVVKGIGPGGRISGNWDSLEVITGDDPALQTALLARLRNTPGINHIHEVREYPLGTLDELAELCVERFTDQLAGKTFAVRCKRVGHHPFTSNDVNREIGSRLMLTGVPAGVSLRDPQVVVQLEIRQ